MTSSDPATAAALLRSTGQLVDGIQRRLAERGFADVRPVAGFAFSLLSQGPATASTLAVHLGFTKQAAAQLTAQLIDRGYVRRERDPEDRRAWLLVLTDRGWACTAAADAAASDVMQQWRAQLPAGHFDQLSEALRLIALPGPLRPAW